METDSMREASDTSERQRERHVKRVMKRLKWDRILEIDRWTGRGRLRDYEKYREMQKGIHRETHTHL